MSTRFVLTVFICSVIAFFGAKSNAQDLESPCPRLFLYEPRGQQSDRWYGILTLLSDTDLSGVWLRLIFDSPSLQIGNWFGEVKTEDKKDYLIKNRNHKLPANTPYPLRFFVKYDPSKPAPKLVSFRLNAKTVCPEAQATTTPFPTSEQLFTNADARPTSPLPPPEPAIPSQTNFNDPNTSGQETDVVVDNDPDQNFKLVDSDVECGTVAVQPRPLILFGHKTEAGQYPWHAALYHSKGGSLNYVCGGSLISRQHVITVAHCVSAQRSGAVLNPDILVIYLGKYYLKQWSNTGVQDHPVSKIVRHPQYDSKTYANDIAVVKLRQPAQFTDFVRPVCLWDGPTDFNPLVGKFGTVVGWGFDENGKLTEELAMINMPFVAKEDCIYSFPDFFSRFTTKETFCAGFINGTSVCNGDSGGGMVMRRKTGNPNKMVYYLRGLVSVSVALQKEFKCDPQHYVVFTDAAKYPDFIKQALEA